MIEKKLEEYIAANITDEDPVLAELSRETYLKVLNPRMLSGHIQGKFLEIISKMVSPQNILEIGTFTGYSSICLAKGLKENGKLYTIDHNDELLSIQKKYITKAGLDEKIELISGDAIEIVKKLDIVFDLVFIDADKTSYSEYYKLILNKTKPGGVILADNVLWNKKVIDPKSNDGDTRAIKEFNELVKNDPATEVLILPLRDGISVIRKL